MSTMHAAVVTSFEEPPHYLEHEVPVASHPSHQLVDVLAVGLHPRVRSGASGSHYTSTGSLPLIPGVDGVGRLADGSLIYFVADDDLPGPMADKALVDMRRSVPLTDGSHLSRIAAGMNPAMSSWIALRRRVSLQPGQSVMVLGATGSAGAMAVQIAKLLGAGEVVAVGRNQARLEELTGLGAQIVALTDDAAANAAAIGSAGANVDIVLDYLWGPPAATTMMSLMQARADRSAAVDWIQIGSVAGQDISLPSALLRAANLRILGNGQGSVSPRGYLAEFPALIDAFDSGHLSVTPREVALADVEKAWSDTDPGGTRTVLLPSGTA